MTMINNFYHNLKNRGKDAKDWINTFTEVEYLGNNKFGASITPGNRVFFDKADGNKPKKHKLTDDRPTKDYVLVQSAKCCVEVYPFYAKYYDVNHEEVRLYEERWVVQRLFKEPDEWRDVDAYKPIIAVEETDTGITVATTYKTDYGSLVVKYIQRDGAALKHDIVFANTSGLTQTFRVIQRWTGIVGSKCNGKTAPVVENFPFFAFHSADKTQRKFNISENLRGMVFNKDRTKKTDHCLQLPVSIDTHAQGMKTNFIYTKWILAQNESLTIDPDTATLDDPTEDGYIIQDIPDIYQRINDATSVEFGGWGAGTNVRGYVEWDISSLVGKTLTANPVFKYEGSSDETTDEEINPITKEPPSVASDEDLFGYIANKAIYYFDTFGIHGRMWETNPENMVDGNIETFAETTGEFPLNQQDLNTNTCPGTDLGTITKVELRFHGYASNIWSEETKIILDSLGEEHAETLTTSPAWSSWFDITNDPGAPSPWTWEDVQALECEVVSGSDEVTYYCSKVEIRVTYKEAYVDPFNFEVPGPNKEVDLGASAKSDLQEAMDTSQSWFAIGFQSPDDEGGDRYSAFFSEECEETKPTLYVEYMPPAPPVYVPRPTAAVSNPLMF